MIIEHLGKKVGVLNGDGVYVSYRTEEHIFIKFNGLGVSYSVLRKLRALKCHKIVILLQRKDKVEKYIATPELFIDEGIIYKDKDFDYQKILPFNKFNQLELKRYE